MREVSFAPAHLPGVMALLAAEGWPSYSTDAARALRAFTAPGVVAAVSLDGETVAGFAQGMGDGEVQGYLALLAVASAYRRRGIARRLVVELCVRLGVERLDLHAEPGSEPFYEALPHVRATGYRIYPLMRSNG